MNIFIDFEATQGNEIIEIGAVVNNVDSKEHVFKTYVNPTKTKLTSFISNLTGITTKDLEDAPDAPTAFENLFSFLYNLERNMSNWRFYVYGDGDKTFLNTTLKNNEWRNPMGYATILHMIHNMKDYFKVTTSYFKQPMSLIRAFNYVKSLEEEQKHDALEDALMLSVVFSAVENCHPINVLELKKEKKENPSYVFPTGKIFCRTKFNSKKEREFEDIHAAIEWLIDTCIGKSNKDRVHRSRISHRIMMANKKKSKYCDYYWRREK